MSTTEPLVTVVIPTHHRRELLARLLASLEAQTLAPSQYEVIIVHNHTDDGTEKMARAWCEGQPFSARYFRQNFNGPARSRDFGARLARGRYVAFTDDDCVATPDWLRAGAAAFDAAGSASTQPIGLVQGATLPNPGQPRPVLPKTIHIPAATIFFETCNIFYLRDAFVRVGGFSPDFIDLFYGEDTDLGWKVTQGGYDSRFAADALVHHEVFKVSLYRWLAEPRHFVNLPRLVKKYPAMRQHLFLGYFISRDSCYFNLIPLALLLGPFTGPWIAVLALPYFTERFRNGQHFSRLHLRLGRMLMGAARAAVSWWALARGSWRARSLLL